MDGWAITRYAKYAGKHRGIRIGGKDVIVGTRTVDVDGVVVSIDIAEDIEAENEGGKEDDIDSWDS